MSVTAILDSTGTIVEGIYVGRENNSTNQQHYYFTGIASWGTEQTGRRVVILVHWGGPYDRSISSAEYGSWSESSWTKHGDFTIHNQTTGLGSVNRMAVLSVALDNNPSDTDIYIKFSGVLGTGSSCSISIWNVRNASLSDSASGGGSGSSGPTVSPVVSYGDFIIAGCIDSDNTGNILWTGTIEDYDADQNGSSIAVSGSHYSATAADASYDITSDPGTVGIISLLAAVFTAD